MQIQSKDSMEIEQYFYLTFLVGFILIFFKRRSEDAHTSLEFAV